MKNRSLLICCALLGLMFSYPVQSAEKQTAKTDTAATLTEAEQQVIELKKELSDAKERVKTLESRLSDAEDTIQNLQEPDTVIIVNETLPEDGETTRKSVEQMVDGKPLYDTENPYIPVTQADVIAQKFTDELQSQPRAVTRLQEDDLQRGRIRNITRIADQVPGMLYGQSGNEARIAMRGVYTNRTGPEAEQAVAIFEDGVSTRTTTQALGPYIDIKQIDILRGPQGVQYGRNAYAGVINVISNEPDLRGWDASVEGSFAYSDRTRFEGMLNMPVTETFAMRIAASSDVYSGYVGNHEIESDADDLKNRKQQYARWMSKWQPSDNFSMMMNVTSLDQNQTGSGIWGYQQIGAYVDGQYEPGHQFRPPGSETDFGPWGVARNFASQADLENLGLSLSLNWNFGFATFEWLGNTSTFESLQVFDSDYSSGGEARSSDFNGWDSNRDTWSNEFHLKSDQATRFDWMLGLEISSMDSDWGWIETTNSVFSRPDWDATGNYKTDSTAIFANAGYEFNEKLRLFGGLRWYDNEKQIRTGEKESWDGVLWNAGIQYAFSDNIHTYLSASTGYRPGGLNETPGVNLSFDDEKVTAWEIGLKSTLADGKLALNLAAFINDYKDMQAQSFTILPLPGTAGLMDYMTTAGDMKSKGLEAEIQWLPGTHWNISANMAWLDAEFKDYEVPAIAGLPDIEGHTHGDVLSLKGWTPAFSPKYSVGIQASYIVDSAKLGTLTSMIQTNYSSKYYANNLNLDGALQDSQTTTDLRFFWDMPGNNKIRFQLYIENISESKTLRNVMIYNPEERPEIATFLADWGDPMTYGAILSYTY